MKFLIFFTLLKLLRVSYNIIKLNFHIMAVNLLSTQLFLLERQKLGVKAGPAGSPTYADLFFSGINQKNKNVGPDGPSSTPVLPLHYSAWAGHTYIWNLSILFSTKSWDCHLFFPCCTLQCETSRSCLPQEYWFKFFQKETNFLYEEPRKGNLFARKLDLNFQTAENVFLHKLELKNSFPQWTVLTLLLFLFFFSSKIQNLSSGIPQKHHFYGATSDSFLCVLYLSFYCNE